MTVILKTYIGAQHMGFSTCTGIENQRCSLCHWVVLSKLSASLSLSLALSLTLYLIWDTLREFESQRGCMSPMNAMQ